MRRESYDRTMSLVNSEDRTALVSYSTPPPDPNGKECRSRMTGGYFGQRRENGRMNDIADEEVYGHKGHDKWEKAGHVNESQEL